MYLIRLTGFKAIQYCRQIRLYTKNLGLWSGPYGGHNIHDDTVCGDAILSGARSHLGHGLQRERGHLVGRLYYGRNDPWRCPVSRQRSH